MRLAVYSRPLMTQVAISTAPEAVVQHGVTRRAARGSLLLQQHPAVLPASLKPVSSSATSDGPASNGEQAASGSQATVPLQSAAAHSRRVSEEMAWSPAAAQLASSALHSSRTPASQGPAPLGRKKQGLGARGGVQKLKNNAGTVAQRQMHTPQQTSGRKQKRKNKGKKSVL